MKSELVIPNLHVILIHYPLGLLVVGVLIETFAFLWRRSGFRAAGRWMILLGALSSVPAAYSGVYALHDVAFPEGSAAAVGPWVESAGSSALSAAAWDYLTRHVWLQAISTLLSVLAVVVWIACSDIWRRKLHFPLLFMLLASVGLTGVGAWFAGEAVYRERAGVEVAVTPGERQHTTESTTAPTTEPTTTTAEPGSQPAARMAQEGARDLHAWAQYVMPPLQTHVTLAGVALALASVSIGLSIRRMVQLAAAERQFGDLAAVLGTQGTVLDSDSSDPLYTTPAEAHTQSQRQSLRAVAAGTDLTPASRFWLLTFFASVLTSLTGAWYLGIDFGSFVPKELWDLIYNDVPERKRRFVHLVSGSVVVLTPLVLALLARFAPRRKIVFAFFTLVLLAAVANQTWVGILMLFDTVAGPVTGWNG